MAGLRLQVAGWCVSGGGWCILIVGRCVRVAYLRYRATVGVYSLVDVVYLRLVFTLRELEAVYFGGLLIVLPEQFQTYRKF